MKDGNDEAYVVRYGEYARILRTELGEKPAKEYTGHYHTIKNK
jgi:hypothetical protein